MRSQPVGSGTDTIVQLIVAMAGTGTLVATVQGLFTRRKTRSEVAETDASATKVIADAAALVVANVQSDNVTLRQENMRRDAEITRLQEVVGWLVAWREAAERNFERHERWDEHVLEAIRKCTTTHDWVDPVFSELPPPLRPNLPRPPALSGDRPGAS